MSTDPWGIYDRYVDALGKSRRLTPETRRAILSAMGLDPRRPGRPPEPPVRVHTPGRRRSLPGPADLVLEDGTTRKGIRALPRDLPLGYHRLRPLDGGQDVRLIASPGRCFLPPDLHTWGWSVQLYAARSRQSWGMGDLADLRRLARWAAGQGAGLLLVNPLNASAPAPPLEPSPYYPISRRFRSPLYLRIQDVPGADALGEDLARLAEAGRALNQERRIDRDAVHRLKLRALEQLWARFRAEPVAAQQRRFERFCREQGEALCQFGVYSVLAERHGRDWRTWPREYHRPDAPAVAQVAAEQAERVTFHGWLQWLVDEQLARAARELAPMMDLPIGFDPGGVDAWTWQDLLALDVSMGAPPDDFNTLGQDWGLPPFVPHRLQLAGYEPFIQTIRTTLRHAYGLRIDHALGLFRLFWVPRGVGPAHGGYVRYPVEDLLAIVALESWRAQAVIVGEDLGTVESGVQERLRRARILGYRLLLFADEPPAQYPKLSLAALTNHDVPTIAGLWSGSDLAMQHRLRLNPNEAGMHTMFARCRRAARAAEDADLQAVIPGAYRALSRARSMLVAATLEDALAIPDRPNVPGTVTEWPNWSLALPKPLEDIEKEPLVKEVAETLAAGRRGKGNARPSAES